MREGVVVWPPAVPGKSTAAASVNATHRNRTSSNGVFRQSIGCDGTVLVNGIQFTVSGAHALSGSDAACCAV